MTSKLTGRYSTLGSAEAEFQPGSKSRVLKNFLGIKRKREMDIREWEALQRTIAKAIDTFDAAHQFTAHDIVDLHKIWLGEIYPWAGQYRQVNISKGNFHFAAANQIEKLIATFEKNELKKFTPCNFSDKNAITEAIAIVHTELVLIHPFRDGNGRIARLISHLMALQAGLPLLDFDGLQGRKKQEYFLAVQSGMSNDYQPMIEVFKAITKRTLSVSR